MIDCKQTAAAIYLMTASGARGSNEGAMIAGNLCEEDLEYGEDSVLGNGASGYVYLATYKKTGQMMALKSINVFDQGKRH